MVKRAETSPKTAISHGFHEKHARNTKDFTLISGRVMRNPMSLHVSPPFAKNFYFFEVGSSPEPRYDGRGYRNHAHVTHNQRTRKTARYCFRIVDFSGVMNILSSTSSNYMKTHTSGCARCKPRFASNSQLTSTSKGNNSSCFGS